MKAMLMLVALIASACLVPEAEEPVPCTPCRFKCDQDFGDSCKACRAENCPDMASAARGVHGANERRDCS